jgi:hypothetical protein
MLEILAAAAARPVAARPAESPQLEEVIVVYKTHFDIGYTDLTRNVVEYYRARMIDKALEIVDRTRELPREQRFVWTIPGWPMAQILWPGQDPGRRKRVLEAYRDGYFVTHALPFTTEDEFLDIETMVRGMEFSSRLARENGKELPRDAKMTDVPSHAWLLPTMLKHAGVEFLHLGCNGGSTGPDVPMLFWWEGPDGSRLLTFYSQNYGSALEPPAGWPYKVWLALIHTGDNQGPPNPEDVQRLRAQAAEKLPGVKLRFGRLSDFSDALRAAHPDLTARLAVVRGDMPDTWVQGLMAMPQDTKRGEITRPRIAALEALMTQMAGWGFPAAAPADLATAYEQSLLYGEHTWGIDFKKFGPRVYGEEFRRDYAEDKYALAVESYGEHKSYNRRAEEIVAPALAACTAALARGVKAEGWRVTVYNPLPWPRDGAVEVEAEAGAPAALKDASSGESIPAEKDGRRLRLVARGIPAMGYRTYVAASAAYSEPTDLAIHEGDRVLMNAYFRVTLDPARGAVASIAEVDSGRELVDGSGAYGFGQHFRERYNQADIDAYAKAYIRHMEQGWPLPDIARAGLPPARHEIVAARDMGLEFRPGGPASVSAVMTAPPGELGYAVALRVTLYSNLPYVELTWSALDKPMDTWPEAGWLALPFQIANPSFRLGRLGGIVDVAKDVVRGANHEMYKLTNGMAILGPGGAGVGLCAVDSPVVSLEHSGGYRYSKNFVPTKAVVFVNLYNNLFGTNFQQWCGGSWTSRVRIWSFDKYEPAASLITPAREARLELEAGCGDGAAGTAALENQGLTLSRTGVEVTAFGPNPDGPGLILRLWEQAGLDGACTVQLPAGLNVAKVQPCDLRGRPVKSEAPAVREGAFNVSLGHNGPATFLLG